MQMLKTGSMVQGKKQNYQIGQNLSVTANSASYRCQGEDGRAYRLKLYQKDCPAMGEARKRFLSLPSSPGLARPEDIGEVSGLEFDVYGNCGADLSSHNVGIQELVRLVIPQLNYGLYQAHKGGILIRDIRPEHILFDSESRKACFAGYSNLALLAGGATATKAPARGIPALYAPPEYQTMGWSVYSDYYALGIALLLNRKGQTPFAGLSGPQIQEKARQWSLPGLDRDYLTKTPYSVLSAEQKILYLILGLTIPDPHKRWGFGEVRCWSTGQEIPLLQTGEKVRYEMTAPFLVNGKRCWDYGQLGRELLKRGDSSEKELGELLGHLNRQNKKLGAKVGQIVNQSGLSTKGRTFRAGYTLAPGTGGFWWEGTCYQNTGELVAASKKRGVSLLEQILRDGCFSFLLELRGIKTSAQQQTLERFRQMEQWEREEKGKGAARFTMQMGAGKGKGFQAGGKEYASFGQLFAEYEKKGNRLKEISPQILKSQMFQGWAWSKGYGAAAAAAAKAGTDPEKAFYALLSLGEKNGSEKEKRLSRRLWLQWGTDAPITWLGEHLDWYETEAGFDAGFHWKRWSEESSLEELSRNSQGMALAYQNFVRNTETNPICLSCGIPANPEKPIRPKRAEAFFCCTWNQLEVSADFVRQKGEPVQTGQLKQWCGQALKEATQWLAAEKQNAANSQAALNSPGLSKGEGGAVAAMTLWLLFSGYLFLLCLPRAGILLGGVLFLVAAAFPLFVLSWCYTRKMRRTQTAARQNLLSSHLARIQQLEQEAVSQEARIQNALQAGKGCVISAKETVTSFQMSLRAAEVENEMEGAGYKAAFILSSIAPVEMMILAETLDYPTFLSAAGYCGIASFLIVWRGGLSVSKAVKGFLFIAISAMILYAIFHSWMLAGAIAIVVVGCVLLQYF